MFNWSLPEPLYEAMLPLAESQGPWDLAVTVLVFASIGYVCVFAVRRFLISKQGPTPLTDRAAYKSFKGGRP